MDRTDQRSLGFWRCWGLVVGGAIGSAVFMMPAVMAPYGGTGLVSLVAATLGALSIALVFGMLARRVTVTGGAYAYTRAGFGDFAGFLIAWGCGSASGSPAPPSPSHLPRTPARSFRRSARAAG